MSAAQAIRREILFHGRVQGVGFRYTTCDIARRYAVTGYVQNLPDGRVKLLAEGTPAELDRFITALTAEMADHIHGQQEPNDPHSSTATGEFTTFTVRR